MLRYVRVPHGAKVLLVLPFWSNKIFHLGKTVEIRSTATNHRGVTWVCESGSWFITGRFDLYECEGPLSQARWEELRTRHMVAGDRYYGANTYAWHLRRAQRVSAIPCAHYSQVVWVIYGG